jgi:hypothetical protein
MLQHEPILKVHPKKPDTKGHMLYDPICVKSPELANTQDANQWLPRAGSVWGKWGLTVFGCVENI